MSTKKRVRMTFQIDAHLRTALKKTAARSGRSPSDLANEALRRTVLLDERLDAIAGEARKQKHLARPHEEIVAEFERDGLL